MGALRKNCEILRFACRVPGVLVHCLSRQAIRWPSGAEGPSVPYCQGHTRTEPPHANLGPGHRRQCAQTQCKRPRADRRFGASLKARFGPLFGRGAGRCATSSRAGRPSGPQVSFSLCLSSLASHAAILLPMGLLLASGPSLEDKLPTPGCRPGQSLQWFTDLGGRQHFSWPVAPLQPARRAAQKGHALRRGGSMYNGCREETAGP